MLQETNMPNKVNRIVSQSQRMNIFFWFFKVLQDWWTWPINHLIWFWSIKTEFAISQSKMVPLPWNKKQNISFEIQTCRLNSSPYMWPLGLTLAVTLTLSAQVQIWDLPYLSQKWFNCHEMTIKHRLNSGPQRPSSTLTLAMTLKMRGRDLPDSGRTGGGGCRCLRVVASSYCCLTSLNGSRHTGPGF